MSIGVANLIPAKAMDVVITSNETPVVDTSNPIVTTPPSNNGNNVITDNSATVPTPTQATENSVPSTPAPQNNQPNPKINPCQ